MYVLQRIEVLNEDLCNAIVYRVTQNCCRCRQELGLFQVIVKVEKRFDYDKLTLYTTLTMTPSDH